MSANSNNQGRAYEYVIINRLYEYISEYRRANIIKNSSYEAAKKAYSEISSQLKEILPLSADAAIAKLYELEPLIFEDNDEVELRIQKDGEGEEGDVRDILIVRSAIGWEIGLSIKHNHFAVKHSRLSTTIDFGQKWYKKSCSETYWEELNEVFDKLDSYIEQGKEWNQVRNKDDEIYVPILKAFMKELNTAYKADNGICKRFVEYLMGTSDFYKVISIDSRRTTEIQCYNFHGQLNKRGKRKPKLCVPLVNLPDEIYHIDFKRDSKTTIEIVMNNGWSFSFRIHNADRRVAKTLKFDIQFIGVPVVLTIDCSWISIPDDSFLYDFTPQTSLMVAEDDITGNYGKKD